MQQQFTTLLGKSVRRIAQMRGGGSALPGLFVEKIDPQFIKRSLTQLPRGVVLISGTNGKTTTTKMVVELLESQGLKVFTNRTGSNFTRGVAAALLGEVDKKGKMHADIAVLELDEAYAVHFVKTVQPNYCLFLNVMRDQLDRFGEIDNTAKMLRKVAEVAKVGIVINRDDPRLSSKDFTNGITATCRTYGVDHALLKLFPSDDAMRGEVNSQKVSKNPAADDVSLKAIDGQHATIHYGGNDHTLDLKLKGVYNIHNAVGALALIRLIMGKDLNESAMLAALKNVKPAFGRGETIKVDGNDCELVLVKNPSGFRLSLSSFDPKGYHTMIAINDNYADGRDMSWLWDVDFNSLAEHGVAEVTGIRAYDMALRLQYDEVSTSHVNTNLPAALNNFLQTGSGKPKRIFCTYTAMLALRRELAKRTDVEVIR